jgi:H+/Cl- antiporter ClcA
VDFNPQKGEAKMIDTQEKPKLYLRLMGMVFLLGIASALVTFIFIALSNQAISVVWEQGIKASGLDPRLYTFLACSLGGLAVGLLVKVFGDHEGIFFKLMREFGETGRFKYQNAPGILLTAFVSLMTGGALGPEAPLLDACGGMGTLISDKLKFNEDETRTMGFAGVSGMLAAFITEPFGGALLAIESAQSGASGKKSIYFWMLFPSLLASAGAMVVFYLLAGDFFGPLFSFPDYTPTLKDLLLAVPLSLVGGLAGIVFMLMLNRLQGVMQRFKDKLVLRGLIGGLGMGIIGALLPLTLFAGDNQVEELVKGAAAIGFGMLILLAFAKLFATSLLLATGWKGGYIFPILFSGVALGMACEVLFPSIPVAVTVASVLAGALVTSLRAPLFSALFTIIMVDAGIAGVVAIAVVCSALMAAILVLLQARNQASKAAIESEP